jgi:glycopeptide antibiotics resistance protein
MASVLLVAYVGVVMVATLSPTPLDQGYASAIERFLSVLHRNGVPLWFGYNRLEFSANIAMFVPLGFLAVMLVSARLWWSALLVCPAMSVAIEVTQATALSSRFATVTDVLANSLGAVVGILIAVALRALVYERDQKILNRAEWERGRPAMPVR